MCVGRLQRAFFKIKRFTLVLFHASKSQQNCGGVSLSSLLWCLMTDWVARRQKWSHSLRHWACHVIYVLTQISLVVIRLWFNDLKTQSIFVFEILKYSTLKCKNTNYITFCQLCKNTKYKILKSILNTYFKYMYLNTCPALDVSMSKV